MASHHGAAADSAPATIASAAMPNGAAECHENE